MLIIVGCSQELDTERLEQVQDEIIETRDDCTASAPSNVFISGPEIVCKGYSGQFCVENLDGPAVIEWNLLGQVTFTPWNCIALNLINANEEGILLVANVTIGELEFCVEKTIVVVESGPPC